MDQTLDEVGLMDTNQLITLAGLLFSVAGSWGVVKYQGGESAKAIASQAAEIARLTTDVAVLRSQAAGADRRLTESLSLIRDTINQSEARVIAHFDAAVQALRGEK